METKTVTYVGQKELNKQTEAARLARSVGH